MAHIEASFFNRRFEDDAFSEQMILALTQAVASVLGEEAGRDTTVILRGVDAGSWGFQGQPLSRRQAVPSKENAGA